MAGTPRTTQQKLQVINNDPILWLKNFVKIVDNNGDLIPFEVNDEQKEFINDRIRYNVIGKSRQLGMTTLMLGLMLYSASTKANTSYLIVANDGDTIRNVFNRLKGMYDSIPDKYKVGEKTNNRNELTLENGSRISVKPAKVDAGRSFTCEMILCTEFAFWDDKCQDEGLLALENALAKNGSAFIVLESTAHGMSNEYYKIFTNAYKGKSKYKSFFFPYYKNTKQFKHEYKLATEWYKSENHGHMLSEKDLTSYELDLYKKGAKLYHLVWRQWKLLDISVDKFNQEYPSIPEEMFISTHAGVFNAKKVSERKQNIPRPLIYEEILSPLPQSLVQYLNKGLFLYSNVSSKMDYWGGIDTAAGLKGDNSATSIIDNNGEQVCVFYRNDIPVYQYAKLVYDLGMYWNYCAYLPERNSYGLELINRLRKELGYVNVLRVKKFSTNGIHYEIGWNTDNVSKNKLISDFKEAFECGLCQVNDRETLDEMAIFVDKDGKMGNVRGSNNYDDLVIATALSIQAMKVKKRYV